MKENMKTMNPTIQQLSIKGNIEDKLEWCKF